MSVCARQAKGYGKACLSLTQFGRRAQRSIGLKSCWLSAASYSTKPIPENKLGTVLAQTIQVWLL